ncbi:formate dehydrogenase accessory protein FdhE [Roseateles koreensis]|uniref:Protein FdhE homolog n=1 Tax=Roseateles koreensis TaxID=2987526 RepID=A0ABT5KLI2_9BURK|nr:formate dehydrogenase accessory protein FdhE [Roseateles koreensis]MDC8783721.1 formate dehydrogenase accessory protein FdhE [Roseateles koreensis]
MTVTQAAKLMSPEEIAVRAGEQIPFLLYPEPGVFAERALRLRQLAQGHAMADYLLFAAELAQAQHEQFKRPAHLALPSAAQIEAAANVGQALLKADNWPLDPLWRDGLRSLMQTLATRLPQGAARHAVQALAQAPDETLDQQAQRLLSGVMLGLDLATAPLIAAALQLHWVRLVTQLQAQFEQAQSVQKSVQINSSVLAPFGRIDDPLVCPCCASRPVASITRIGADGAGFRYLSCSLCATQWHYVRIKCTHCQSTKGISFQSLLAQDDEQPSGSEAVQVECCEPCGHYLKIVHMEKDQQVEPHADDLASLTLDLLVSETGLIRHGVNLMLLFGESNEPGEPVEFADIDVTDPPPDPKVH